MSAIVIIASQRWDMLERVLDGLAHNEVAGWTLFVQVDNCTAAHKTVEVARKASHFIETHVRLSGQRTLGNRYNTVKGLLWAFRAHDFAVCLDDDAVPAPDMLDLACWYRINTPPAFCYSLVNLHQDRWLDQPLTLFQQTWYYGWANCFTREQFFGNLLPALETVNYDCIDTSVMQENHRKRRLFIPAPVLSRAKNIGVNGMNTTPEHFNESLIAAPCSVQRHGMTFSFAESLRKEIWLTEEQLRAEHARVSRQEW